MATGREKDLLDFKLLIDGWGKRYIAEILSSSENGHLSEAEEWVEKYEKEMDNF
jgi:hypothetical protein